MISSLRKDFFLYPLFVEQKGILYLFKSMQQVKESVSDFIKYQSKHL